MSERSRQLNSSSRRGGFASTQWSVVLAARRDPARRQAALERLCRTYWLPVYGYLRRRGNSPADAEDMTQGFFAHVITGDFLDRPDPARGRFRGYLIGALKQFVGHERARASAQKRGGDRIFVDLSAVDLEQEFSAIDQSQLDASEAYELSWAVTVLGQAVGRLEEEQRVAGRAKVFAVLKPLLHTVPAPGDYERVAGALGASRATVAVWLHRLTRRLAELVKLEVAATLESQEDAEEELRHLLAVFRR